jgi:hypothetical protein
LYGGYKWVGSSRKNIEDRVNVLEKNLEKIEERLNDGDKRFVEQDITNEVITKSTLALIEFEMQYCISEKKPITQGLEEAKKELHNYLSRR